MTDAAKTLLIRHAESLANDAARPVSLSFDPPEAWYSESNGKLAVASAIRELLAAATKPPVVAGLTEEERAVLAYGRCLARSQAHGEWAVKAFGDLLERTRDPGKYVVVRREDLDWVWSCADNHYQSELRALGQERLDENECGREVKAALDRVNAAMSLAPAIAKGGEPGEGK